MDNPRERDEFERIRLHGEIEKARRMIAMYGDHRETYRQRIEECVHAIGRLDERLGAGR